MSNIELTKYYLGQQMTTSQMPETAYFDIQKALDEHFQKNWTWELVDERVVEDGSGVNVMTTVMLYTPGRVYTGRSYCKVRDYHENHLHALLNACKSFMTVGKATQPTPIPQTSPQQMSADQISAMLGQQQAPQQPIDTAAQFYNYKDEQGRPANEVPFDQMTDNCTKELQQEMGMVQKDEPDQVPFNTGNPGGMVYPPNNPQPPQQNMAQAPQPQQQTGLINGYTQQQIDRMNKFKKDFDITDDVMFGNYVNTWDKRFTSKKDINPGNIDAFLAWVDTLGE